MKNKQHELILRAFLESKIPEVIKQDQPAFILIDSALGGYCTRVLRGDKLINMHQVITTEDKKVFSDLINQNKDERKNLRFMITNFAPKREVKTKNGKTYIKRPKVQRLITPDRLRRKRLLKAFHLERREKAKKDKDAYIELCKKTFEKEKREAKEAKKAKKASKGKK